MLRITLQKPYIFVADDTPPPIAGDDQALVRIKRIGVCGTDYHAFTGRQPFFKYPRVLGHELGVEVLTVPTGCHTVKPGDTCAVEPYLQCGTCPMCLAGKTNACEVLQCLGVHTDGGMVETMAVPVTHLKPSGTLSLDQLALVETLGIGYHAVERATLVPGMNVLVVGAGPIGLSILPFAKAVGANVRVLERAEHRRAFCDRFGVPAFVTMELPLADVVFDATGNAESMAKATDYVAPGGTIVFVGLVNGPVSFDDPAFHKKELTFKASRNSANAFEPIMTMIAQATIDTTPWITHRLKLADIPKVFGTLATEPGLIKAMVEV